MYESHSEVIYALELQVDQSSQASYIEELNFIRVETKWVSYRIPWGDALYIKREQVSKGRILLFNLRKFIERYSLYYLITDLIRKLKKLKYNIKQTIKGLIIKK